MLAAVMCSLRRNCSIDHAYVEYVMLCSFEGVVACSHRTFSRAFAQKHALSKTMYQLSLQVSEALQKEFYERDMQTFSRKIIECLKQVDGNITRFLALDGCEITLGREPNSGETKGKTKPGRKVHTAIDIGSETITNYKIGSANSNEKEAAIEMIQNDPKARGTVWLADAGYLDAKLQQCIADTGGYFLIKSKYNINPQCIKVTEYDVYLGDNDVYYIDPVGKDTEFEHARPLSEVIPKGNNCPVITGPNGRLIGRSYVITRADGTKVFMIFNPTNKSFNDSNLRTSWVYFESNLSDAINIELIGAIYRLRWQIELKFLCLKSHNGWARTPDANYQVCDLFVSASIIGDDIKHFIAMVAMDGTKALNNENEQQSDILHDLSKEKAASHLENDANMYMLTHIPKGHLVSRKAKRIDQDRNKAIAKAVTYSRPSKHTIKTGKSVKSTLDVVQQQANALKSAQEGRSIA